MVNQNLFLNPKLFDEDIEKKFPLDGFGEGLVEAGEQNQNVVAICADLENSLKMMPFKDKFPERFIEVGVAEQNLATVASGLASVGKIPFAGSYAIFSPGRNWEQIRTTICYNNQPVKIIGSHAGVTVGEDGATHQALEDIALMRVLPNMVVLSPVDFYEAKKATLTMVKIPQPCYLRLPRVEAPNITTQETPFIIGKGEVFRGGNPLAGSGRFADATIISTGEMVHSSLLAAKELELNNINVRVINISTIKPLDEKLILLAAEETGAIVTVEDHQITGGLGSAVSELISQNYPVPMKIIGVNDKFGQSGKPEELLETYKLTVQDIIKAITIVLRLKIKSNV